MSELIQKGLCGFAMGAARSDKNFDVRDGLSRPGAVRDREHNDEDVRGESTEECGPSCAPERHLL